MLDRCALVSESMGQPCRRNKGKLPAYAKIAKSCSRSAYCGFCVNVLDFVHGQDPPAGWEAKLEAALAAAARREQEGSGGR